MRRRIVASVAVGLVSLLLFVLWQHLPGSFSTILGIAFGALTFTTWGTVERLRDLYRR
jgi:hypothetical protein